MGLRITTLLLIAVIALSVVVALGHGSEFRNQKLFKKTSKRVEFTKPHKYCASPNDQHKGKPLKEMLQSIPEGLKCDSCMDIIAVLLAAQHQSPSFICDHHLDTADDQEYNMMKAPPNRQRDFQDQIEAALFRKEVCDNTMAELVKQKAHLEREYNRLLGEYMEPVNVLIGKMCIDISCCAASNIPQYFTKQNEETSARSTSSRVPKPAAGFCGKRLDHHLARSKDTIPFYQYLSQVDRFGVDKLNFLIDTKFLKAAYSAYSTRDAFKQRTMHYFEALMLKRCVDKSTTLQTVGGNGRPEWTNNDVGRNVRKAKEEFTVSIEERLDAYCTKANRQYR